jgi:hypothetical protein
LSEGGGAALLRRHARSHREGDNRERDATSRGLPSSRADFDHVMRSGSYLADSKHASVSAAKLDRRHHGAVDGSPLATGRDVQEATRAAA